jgi:hypothetical protein
MTTPMTHVLPVQPSGHHAKDLSQMAGAPNRLSAAEAQDLLADSKRSFDRFDELLAAEKS